MAKYFYECLWYDERDSKGDFTSRDFSTAKAAMNFFNKHKDDDDKYDWLVTKRESEDGGIVDDLVTYYSH